MGEAFAYKEYLAGLLAGVATVITGHPFDTVKVKLQIHNTEAHGIKYKNGLHCTARILQTEGVCSFNVFLLKDCIEGHQHLLLGWLLRVPFLLVYILKQSSHCREDCKVMHLDPK